MTIEGVGETRSLADALSLLCFHVRSSVLINCRCYLEADLRRLLQSLQNFGQVAPLSTLLAAFASFHSAAHFFCRSRAATCPALGSFCVLAFLSDAVAFCCAAADEMICGIGVMTSPTVSAAANTALSMISLPLFPKARGAVGRQSAAVRNRLLTITRIGCTAPSCDRMRPLQAVWLRNSGVGPRSGRLVASGLNGAHHGAR